MTCGGKIHDKGVNARSPGQEWALIELCTDQPIIKSEKSHMVKSCVNGVDMGFELKRMTNVIRAWGQ